MLRQRTSELGLGLEPGAPRCMAQPLTPGALQRFKEKQETEEKLIAKQTCVLIYHRNLCTCSCEPVHPRAVHLLAFWGRLRWTARAHCSLPQRPAPGADPAEAQNVLEKTLLGSLCSRPSVLWYYSQLLCSSRFILLWATVFSSAFPVFSPPFTPVNYSSIIKQK